MTAVSVELVPASEIIGGQCFRKRTGTYVYLRISESSVRFAKMDEGVVWGVSYNGNLARVERDTKVVRMPSTTMLLNIDDHIKWCDIVGVKQDYYRDEPSCGPEPFDGNHKAEGVGGYFGYRGPQ